MISLWETVNGKPHRNFLLLLFFCNWKGFIFLYTVCLGRLNPLWHLMFFLSGGHKEGSMRDHEHGLRSCNSWGTWIVLRFGVFLGEGGWWCRVVCNRVGLVGGGHCAKKITFLYVVRKHGKIITTIQKMSSSNSLFLWIAPLGHYQCPKLSFGFIWKVVENNAVSGNKQVICWLSSWGRGQLRLTIRIMPSEDTVTVRKHAALTHAVHILWINERFHAQQLSNHVL